MTKSLNISLALAVFLFLAVIFQSIFESNTAVVLYTITVVAIALRYFRIKRPVDKTTTDHIYYSLGAIAVALIYI